MDDAVFHFFCKGIHLGRETQFVAVFVSLATLIADNILSAKLVVLEEVTTGRCPLVNLVGRAVAHMGDVVVGLYVVGHFAQTTPAEIGLHLVLVTPLVAQTPDGIVVVRYQGLATQHALFLIVVEGNAVAALEHVVSIVHISEGTSVGQAVVLLEAE